MAVDVRRFPWIRRLAADYAFNFPSVEPFFSGNPTQPSAWADAITRTQAHPRSRAEVARLLEAQQTRRGAPQAAIDAARKLADPKTVAVLTGQQAGLFGGPFFTLLKAHGSLADQVSRNTRCYVAVFWIDAEPRLGRSAPYGLRLDPGGAQHRAARPAGRRPCPRRHRLLDSSITTASTA
jgi:uncharacterized protein YllA (UPF0747 family)